MVATKEMYRLQGVVVSLNTPFDEDNRIDWVSLQRLIDFHLSEGAVGFLLTAQAGEVYELTMSERIELIRRAHAATTGRAELVVGATAKHERDSFVVAQAAIEAGCQGVLVEVPEKRRESARAVTGFVESMASLGMPLLMIQDLDWSGSGLEVDLIAELFDRVSSFRSLKVEVTPSGPKYSAVARATQGRLHLSGGWASQQMIEGLDRGVSVFMPSAMTRLFSLVMNYYYRGERERAKEWFHLLLPILAFTRQHLDISIHFHKRLFRERGLFRTSSVRKRSVQYDAYHEKYGEELMAYLHRVEKKAFAEGH